MSKSANDSFVFEVNKDTEWNKPYKPKANVGTDRVSGLIKTEPKQPEIKKERVQHAPPPNAPSIEQKKQTQTAPVSGPIQVNVTGHEKIDYNSHIPNMYKYRLRGSNKHLFIAYYTLFTKPVYEIYTKMKNRDPIQYTKEVSQAYNMDTQKCSSMFVSLNRWLYGTNSSVQKSESSVLYRASEILVRNAPQRQQNEYPYPQQQHQQPPKDKFIAELPATATSAITQTQEKQYPQMGRYPQSYGPMDYPEPGRYPQGRMYPDEYYDSRMSRDMYPPGYGMNYPMDYPPRYPPMGYYYDRRYDNYDPYGRYPEYDSRSPRGREMGMDPRVDPRMTYDKYDRMRERQPIDNKIQDKNTTRQSTDETNRNNRLAMSDVRPPQLNEMQRDPRDIGRDIPRDLPRDNRESIPRDGRDPRDIGRDIPRELPRDNRESIPREIPRDTRESIGRDGRDPRDIGRDIPREMPREGQRDMIRRDQRDMMRDMMYNIPPDMLDRDPRLMDPRYDPRIDPYYDPRKMGRDMMSRDQMYMNNVRSERDPFTRDMRGDMVRDPRDIGRDARMMEMRPMERMGMDADRMQRGGPMEKDPRGHMGDRMFNVPMNGERDRNERGPDADRKRNFVPQNQYK